MASNRITQQKTEAAEQRVTPKSISLEAGASAESGTPAMGASVQGAVGIKFAPNSAPGLADNFYATQGASAGGVLTGSVSTASNQPTKDYVAGASASPPGLGVSISNEAGGVSEGISRPATLSTPIGTVSWSSNGQGDWSAGVSGPALGISYKEQTVKTCSECLRSGE